ncbi:hypothetical protein BDN70DRAFT_997870 [Pholiota conissans]|uniref:Uncharacterized protein n=1 Tax=Pholiota conissans TaxID=109636 RepID=A0A9P5YQ21_9AGAR|nr:hypothetical protein BDN70DRAFT_997870 [Pholiota conissans]
MPYQSQMPPTGLRRAISGLFPSQKPRKSFSIDGFKFLDLQLISDVPARSKDSELIPSDNKIHKFEAPLPSLPEVCDTAEDNECHREPHTRHVSSASAPLPDIHPVSSLPEPRRFVSQSAPPRSHQNLVEDSDNKALYGRIQFLTQETNDIYTVNLEQLRADLLKATSEKNHLKQRLHRQDEQNHKLMEDLRVANEEKRMLHSELEARSAIIAELLDMNDKLRQDVQTEREEKMDLRERLDNATANLQGKTTQLQEANNVRTRSRNLMTVMTGSINSMEKRIDKLESFIQSLTRQKENAEEQVKSLETKVSELAEVKVQLTSLQKEQETWRGRMDVMIHKVFASERRIRMFNHGIQPHNDRNLQDGANGYPIKRGNIRPKNFSAQFVDAVATLNEAILNAATILQPLYNFSIASTWSGDLERARIILGNWITSLFSKEGWSRPAFFQAVIQIFLVDWCRAIIEAWYPKQQSFAELFMTALLSQKKSSSKSSNRRLHGLSAGENHFEGATTHFQAVQITANASSPDLSSWATEIMNDLISVLPVPNMTRELREDILLPVLTPLVQQAYDIRMALAEGDICGNLRLLIPSSDIHFQPESMSRPDDLTLRIQKNEPADLGDTAGCTGIGLQSISIQKSKSGASFIECTTVLLPTIVLARDLVIS